jgi:polyisoprenoid-binding protein YceI
MNKIVLAAMTNLFAATAISAPVTYSLDGSHTFPSFEADHMGGRSVWRGKFNQTTGRVIYDKEAKTGSIEVTVVMASVDFGLKQMNEEAKLPLIFNVKKYPTATYTGKFTKFHGDAPTEAQGTLTMHGVTRPLTLTIASFLCQRDPIVKKEVCGADAYASFNRKDFGVDYGEAYGFNMAVKLQIQVEGSPAG